MEDLNGHIEQSAQDATGASMAEQETQKVLLIENQEIEQHQVELQSQREDDRFVEVVNPIDTNAEWNAENDAPSEDATLHQEANESVGIQWPRWAKYAVATLTLFVLFWIISSVRHSKPDDVVYWAKDQIRDLDLKDGSKISLNVDSRFSFSNSFGKSDRAVKLEGEAFFDVAQDDTKPFEIEAGAAKIVVVGTCFNVRAEKKSERVDVFVKRGRVSLANQNDESNPVYITAGHRAVLNKKNGKIDEIPAGDSNSMAWKTKDIYFNNDNLEEVVHVISHTYRCKIKIGNKKIRSLTISVNFSKQSLDSVIKVICSTLDLKMTHEGNTIILF